SVSTPTTKWPVTSHIIPPGPREARILTADLEPGAAAVDRLVPLLSPDERERAARFHFRRDAMRWIVARAILRQILGGCLGVDRGAVVLSYGPQGKPAVVAPTGSVDLQFSLAHSSHVAVYAVSAGCPVGIDVEGMRPLSDMDRIAARTFSPRECAALRKLPPGLRAVGFFNCWTRKEAYIKAVGLGLSYPLDRFSVSLAPGEPARLEVVETDPDHVEKWTMGQLAPGPGF